MVLVRRGISPALISDDLPFGTPHRGQLSNSSDRLLDRGAQRLLEFADVTSVVLWLTTGAAACAAGRVFEFSFVHKLELA